MASFDLESYAKEIHKITLEKGFWDGFHELEPFQFYAYKLAMIHSEVTEVLEAIRKSRGEEEVVEELTDIIIRVLDLYYGLKETNEIGWESSIGEVLDAKIEANRERPQRHGVRG
jgi:NTP pyrophosphatase (non-canonical NTP hydrolase)